MQLQKIEKTLEYASVFFMILLTSVITLQVFSRAFHSPIYWSEELARIALIYLTYIAGAYAYSKGKGLRITMFIEKFPLLVQKYINIFTTALSLIVILVVIYSGILLTNQLWNLTTTALTWQKGALTLVIPVAFSLLAIKWVQNMKDLLQERTR